MNLKPEIYMGKKIRFTQLADRQGVFVLAIVEGMHKGVVGKNKMQAFEEAKGFIRRM